MRNLLRKSLLLCHPGCRKRWCQAGGHADIADRKLAGESPARRRHPHRRNRPHDKSTTGSSIWKTRGKPRYEDLWRQLLDSEAEREEVEAIGSFLKGRSELDLKWELA